MMSESIFCFCINCQMLYWPLYDLYFPVMHGNKLFEIEIELKTWAKWIWDDVLFILIARKHAI